MVAASVKYLYERLGAETFQQLVSALLSSQFPRFQAMPLGQADGGAGMGWRKLAAKR